MLFLHMTQNESFDLKPIEIENSLGWIKPKGGLWASPVGAEYGWREWCHENDYPGEGFLVLLDIDLTNTIIINSKVDIELLPDGPQNSTILIMGVKTSIDFEQLKADGVDAIFLTDKGLNNGGYMGLYGWDCASIIILNERCIKSWSREDRCKFEGKYPIDERHQ